MPSVEKAILNPNTSLSVGDALMVAVCGLLVVFMMFRPEGLVKKRSGHAAMSLSQWFRQTLCRNRQ